MIVRFLLLVVFAAPATALAQSSQSCPWLNAGTAAKILGADVSVSAHADSNWSGMCRFVTINGKEGSIEIIIGKTDAHACGANRTSIAAIGNEAWLCSANGTHRQVVQILTGRVRDAWFVVRMAAGSEPAALSSETEPFHSSPIKFLAEQVSGNLY